MNNDLARILIISILIESIWETIKLSIDAIRNKNANDIISKIGALAIAIVICVNYSIDLLNFLGFKDHIPYLGNILTGILCSRGSNFVHDLLKKLQENKPSNINITNQLNKLAGEETYSKEE